MSIPVLGRRLVGVLSLVLIVAGTPVAAQPSLPSAMNPHRSPVSDTADAEWDSDVTGRLSFSQAAYKDWQEGGLNSLSFTASIDGSTERKGNRWAQSHSFRLALGYIDQQERDIQKSEDLIRLETGLQYQGEGFFKLFNPTIAGRLRTQFAKGFNYSSNPYSDIEGHPLANEEAPVQTSAFFSPATLTETLGLTYEPAEVFSLRFGAASKQTIVRERDFRPLYGVAEDKTVRVEAGGQFSSTLDANLSENIRYRSQLNVFFAVNQLENPPDAIWENVVELKVNDWLSTNFEFVAAYDEDTVEAIQIKEVLSVGVNVNLL